MTLLEEQIQPYRSQYPPSMLEDFIDYWEETNLRGKQRWQLEKTWEIGRRLKRWKRQQDQWNWEKSQRFVKVEEPQRKVEDRQESGFSSLKSLFNK